MSFPHSHSGMYDMRKKKQFSMSLKNKKKKWAIKSLAKHAMEAKLYKLSK